MVWTITPKFDPIACFLVRFKECLVGNFSKSDRNTGSRRSCWTARTSSTIQSALLNAVAYNAFACILYVYM